MTELGAHGFACPGTKISMRTLESTQDPEPMALGSHQSQRKRTQLFGLLGLQTVYELVQVAVIMRGGHLIRVRPGPRSWNSAEGDSWQETVDRPGRRPGRDTGRVVRGRVPGLTVPVVGLDIATQLVTTRAATIGFGTVLIAAVAAVSRSGHSTSRGGQPCSQK